tara:strand:- start:11 stop:520 length:510 start_codon:yes stop_codon:yes gene_type:complete
MVQDNIIESNNRLARLSEAHIKEKTDNKTIEDYLEIIYELIQEKGYAAMTDISNHLHVKASSVTQMMKKLDEEGYLIYEKYREIKLTIEGEELAKKIREKHILLIDFLKIIGVNEEIANKDAERIEHYLNSETMNRFSLFVKVIKNNPKLYKILKEDIKENEYLLESTK